MSDLAALLRAMEPRTGVALTQDFAGLTAYEEGTRTRDTEPAGH